MLSRVAAGAVKARPYSSPLRSAVSVQCIRNYAKNKDAQPGPRKPSIRSAAPDTASSNKPPSISQRVASAGTGFNGPLTAKSSDQSGRPRTSSAQDDVTTGPIPSTNTTSHSSGGGPGVTDDTAASARPRADFSSSQAEFQTPGSDANTAPQSTSASAIDPAIAQAQSQAQSRPLPDLTQGIPSTLDAEATGSTSLNLTDDPNRPAAGAGGKGSSDLPKSAYISSADRRRSKMANYMYAALLLLCITGPVYLGRNWETEEEEKKHPEAPSGWGLGLFWNRAKARLASTLDYYNEPVSEKLLPDVEPIFERPFTLVLSLEDLLVHSEWSREHGWRTAKRPGVDYFLRYLQQYYELVIFTSVPNYIAEPVILKLDPFHIVTWPLYREHTRYKNGEYIKDLSFLNRDLSKVILLDTVPSHVKNQPENAIIIDKWKGDKSDKELVSLIPFLEYVATMGFSDTRSVLKSFEGKHIPTEFAAREKVAREKFEKELSEERGHRTKRIGKGFMNSLLGIRPGMGGEAGELSPAEAYEQGKMLQDQIRERGQKQYEALEKEIRENGDKWLADMAADAKKMNDEHMKGMKNSIASVFIGGGGGGGGGGGATAEKK